MPVLGKNRRFKFYPCFDLDDNNNLSNFFLHFGGKGTPFPMSRAYVAHTGKFINPKNWVSK